MPNGDRGLSRAQILKNIDLSLARLRTDYVDLYQCHRYDWDTPLEETMEALTEVVRAGKARYLGFSEWPVEKIGRGDGEDVEHFVSSQPQYSLLWRGPERDVIPYCTANGISQIVWSPLAQGVLTGKYKPGEPPPTDSRAAQESMSDFFGSELRDDALVSVQQLKPIAQDAGLTLSAARARVGAARAQRRVRHRRRIAPDRSRTTPPLAASTLDAATLARDRRDPRRLRRQRGLIAGVVDSRH